MFPSAAKQFDLDSFTHIALGVCIGEAFLGKNIGRKAMIWGAIGQSIPDIDFIASFWMGTTENLLAHRGFTHSIVFCLVAIVLFALLADKLHRPHNVSMQRWIYFFATAVFGHIFLDGFNAYGVGWLEPFSSYRFSLNTIFVADPLFSIFPCVAALALLLSHKGDARRRFWWIFGIAGSTLYLAYCLFNKMTIERYTRQQLASQHIVHERYMTTPTPFNNWLWYVVAGTDSGYHVGFCSVFDTRKNIEFTYFPANRSLLKEVDDHEDLQKLIRFSKQFYTVERKNYTIIFNDLRFGQIGGWKDPRASFTFYYYLDHPEQNDLVIQRGRFQGWNREVWISLFEKIRGN